MKRNDKKKMNIRGKTTTQKQKRKQNINKTHMEYIKK